MKVKELPPEKELQKEINGVVESYLNSNPEFKAIYDAEKRQLLNTKNPDMIMAPAFAEIMGVVFKYFESKYGIEDPEVLSCKFERDKTRYAQ